MKINKAISKTLSSLPMLLGVVFMLAVAGCGTTPTIKVTHIIPYKYVRLEGVNKTYGIYTLIGEPTYQGLGNRILTREVDSINVVGKKEPVSVYQLLGYTEDYGGQMIETIDLYTKGLYAYRIQDWDKAIDLFTKTLKVSPDDGPSQTMLARCNELKINPPGKAWDGTYTMSTK